MSYPISTAIAIYYGRLFVESYMEAGGIVVSNFAIDPILDRLIREAGAEAARKVKNTENV